MTDENTLPSDAQLSNIAVNPAPTPEPVTPADPIATVTNTTTTTVGDVQKSDLTTHSIWKLIDDKMHAAEQDVIKFSIEEYADIADAVREAQKPGNHFYLLIAALYIPMLGLMILMLLKAGAL